MLWHPLMAELADAHDSKSCGEIHAGSTPARGTRAYEKYGKTVLFSFTNILISIWFEIN